MKNKYSFQISDATKNILIDFDGVIVDSNRFKENAIEKTIYNLFNKNKNSLEAISYFNKYAGISREKKLSKFFNSKEVNLIMKDYSLLCKDFYSNAKPTTGVIQFLKNINTKFPQLNLFILSGGEKDEITYFLKKNEMLSFFKDLLCSEYSKSIHILNNNFSSEDLFIGDSQSDLNAAKENNLRFILITEFSSENSKPNIKEIKYTSQIFKNLSSIQF